MDFHFKPYHPIENLSREEFIATIYDNGLAGGEFIVQEKIHGANLCFITDGQVIYSAKRTGLLKEDERFFNFQKVRDKYKEQILKAHSLVTKLYPETDLLYIFGELFGGYYPHPDVPKVKDAIQLQQGVCYSADNDFYAFDLRIHNASYLSLDESMSIFEELGFLYAKELFRGTLDACLAFPYEFESKIPGYLGLPVIASNIAEGLVIKPLEAKFLPSKARVIIKNKNPKYEEKIIKKTKHKKTKVKLTDACKKLAQEAENYINQNRLDAAISKLGEVHDGQLIGFLAKDAYEDFAKDFIKELEALDKEEQKQIRQIISKTAGVLVRS
ncbi:MAG: hypothetical protein O2962_02405 [Cyanobacteria bacterium]|nr:hypothetical protein [Cyanobacteriota bacterium]